MSFAELNLSEPILRAVREEGYEIATPIQLQAIPHVLAGRDLVGCAQTGTGKTAAFALPTLERLLTNGSRPREKGRKIRCLVLSPTRELTSQIAESFRAYGRHTGLRHAVVYGGVGQNPQVRALQQGVDILVATPGRLLDLMNQGHVNLSQVKILILDEADQMFDMGFLRDLQRIVARVPRERQTLLFSATMPPPIRQLANEWLHDPASVAVAPQATTAERVKQSVYFVEKPNKSRLLTHYLKSEQTRRTLVFTRTKHGADKLVKVLMQEGLRAAAIHGNKSQNARQRALEQFKSQHPPILVATDIASRGLDIDGVSHVVNFELPMTPEAYVHRIGRTARAGAEGIAITLCDGEERSMLREIERITRQKLDVAKPDASLGITDSQITPREYVPQGERPRYGHRPQGGGYAGNGHSGGRHSGGRYAGGSSSGHARPGKRKRFGSGGRPSNDGSGGSRGGGGHAGGRHTAGGHAAQAEHAPHAAFGRGRVKKQRRFSQA